MKPKSITLFFLLISTLAAPVRALDFTPRYKDVPDNGGWVTKRLYFADGAKYYTLTPGNDVNMTGESNALRFTFDELEGSTLLLRNSEFTPENSFQEDLEKYRETLSSYLPPGVSDVTVVEEKENPIAINEWRSHGFVISCKLPGSTLRVAITFLNLDKKQQIVVVTTAYGEVFKEAQERSNAIISSLHLITEEKLTTPATT